MQKIGLIAGEGEFPLLLAEEAKNRGVKVITAGILNHTSIEIERYSDKVEWISLGALEALIQFFKEEGVESAIMAGRVPKPAFVQGMVPLDDRSRMILAKTSDHRDTTLLKGLIGELENHGIRFLDSSSFLEPYLAKEGVLGKYVPSPHHWRDIELGKKGALQLGGLDIGQTVVVKDQLIVAVEGIEGTDETIHRAGKVAGEGGVVVKMARPHQDMRFDIPVIGPKTLDSLREAKAAVLAVEAGKTLILQDWFFLQQADEMKLVVVGI